MREKIIAVCVALFVLVLLFPSTTLAKLGLGKPVAVSGEGKRYEIDGLPVVVLEGSYYEMGHQYGDLMKNEIKTIISVGNLGLLGLLGKDALEQANTLFAQQVGQFPKRFREIYRGISAGAGVSEEELAIPEHLIALFCAQESGLFCSSLTVWGDYTSDGKLVMGRNFEFPALYLAFSKQMCLVVYNPVDGCVPSASFGYAGQIGSVQTFNRAGLVQELNVGIGFPNDNTQVQPDRIMILVLLLQLSLDSETMEQLEAGVKTYRSNFTLMNTIADSKTAKTCELGTRDMMVRKNDAIGLNVATNFLAHPSWGEHGYGDHRRNFLLKAANEKKGKLSPDAVKTIMETPTSKGGVMAANEKFFETENRNGNPMPGISTLYQFVYVPVDNHLSIHIPARNSRWIEIDLRQLFK